MRYLLCHNYISYLLLCVETHVTEGTDPSWYIVYKFNLINLIYFSCIHKQNCIGLSTFVLCQGPSHVSIVTESYEMIHS